MIGYYKLDKSSLDKISQDKIDISNNIYELCCPLVVDNKNRLPKYLLYLYEMFEIPIINIDELDTFDFNKYSFLSRKVGKISEYLKINISIENEEEEENIGHALRVAAFSKILSESIGLEKEQVKDIYYAALFHDIGKSLVPEEILAKKEKLSDDEYELIKSHTIVVDKVLDELLPESILEMIKSHHERCDGSGYPKGIVLKNIGAKIIGIADSYDAMTSNRVYGNNKDVNNALEELRLCTKEKEAGGKGVLFDKELVNKFADLMEKDSSVCEF